MQAELFISVREQTAGRYEVLGELARDERGGVVCLAREASDGRTLVALRLSRVGTRPDGSGEYSVDVVPELDGSLPAEGRACPACGMAVTDWRRYCSHCGGDLADAEEPAMQGRSRTEVLQAIRKAAGAHFEVLGDMRRAGGGGRVYFAREIATGRLVALSLHREEGAAREEYSLGVTQLIRPPAAPPAGPTPAPRETPTPTPAPPHSPATTPDAPHAVRVCPTCRAEFDAQTRFCPRDGAALAAKVQDGLIGQLIAERYHILERIGEGGFGQVYLAEHAKMGRRCAIKVMNPSVRQDPESVGRFAREAANTSRINHPNIATIYDFGETPEGLLYLVMELIEGETLGEVLRRERVLSPQRAAETARQIADALVAAHAHGIVHRDLKPQNILLARGYQGDELVKVVDFGIAKAVQGDWQNITRTGLVIGTLEYMSPEQLMGEQVDGRSDIYSLGCLLFEMLTGERTFSGPSGQVVIARRMTEEPPRVRELNPAVPQVLDDLVAMALARDPASRFQSAEGLRDALAAALRAGTEERALTLRPVTGETPVSASSAPTAAASVSSRRRAAPLVLGGAVAAVLLAGGVLRLRPDRATPMPMLPAVDSVPGAAALAPVTTATSTPAEPEAPAVHEPAAAPAPTAAGTRAAAAASVPEPVADAELRIAATPAGASVSLDGRSVRGRTLSLSPGRHRVRVSAEGYASADTTFTVRAGEKLAWAPTLRPAEPAPPPEAPRVVEPERVAAPAPAPATPSATPPALATPEVSAAEMARIRAVLDRFARAIEGRRVDRLRSAYPGMTATEQSTWKAFFDGVRDVRAQLADVRPPQVSDSGAQVSFTLMLAFTDKSGLQQAVQRYRATLVRSGSDWRLDAVRPE